MSRNFPFLSSISQLGSQLHKRTCRPLSTIPQYFSSRLMPYCWPLVLYSPWQCHLAFSFSSSSVWFNFKWKTKTAVTTAVSSSHSQMKADWSKRPITFWKQRDFQEIEFKSTYIHHILSPVLHKCKMQGIFCHMAPCVQ